MNWLPTWLNLHKKGVFHGAIEPDQYSVSHRQEGQYEVHTDRHQPFQVQNRLPDRQECVGGLETLNAQYKLFCAIL